MHSDGRVRNKPEEPTEPLHIQDPRSGSRRGEPCFDSFGSSLNWIDQVVEFVDRYAPRKCTEGR